MDPIQLIRHDHQQLERLFRRLEQALSSGEPRQSAAALRDVTRELSIHAAVEEQFVYPALRATAGADGVLFAVEEHHAAKVLLSELRATRPADPRFETKARLLLRDVREHMQEEERELLPALEKGLEPEQLRELGGAVANARLLSPTRPHPLAPETPPGNLLVGPILGVFDRIADAARDGVLSVGAALRGAGETAVILLRRLSSQAERRGREAVDDLTVRARVATLEVRDVGRRTLEEAAGRSAEAARQLREPARRTARKVRRAARAATTTR